jgi:hypothetical protein
MKLWKFSREFPEDFISHFGLLKVSSIENI